MTVEEIEQAEGAFSVNSHIHRFHIPRTTSHSTKERECIKTVAVSILAHLVCVAPSELHMGRKVVGWMEDECE